MSLIRSARLLASGAVFAAILLAGCGLAESGCGSGAAGCTQGPTAAPGGLSREDAVARARALAPGSNASASVVWASIETDPFAPRGSAPPGRLVWIVRLQGTRGISPCPSGFLEGPPDASVPGCLDGDGGIDVVIEYFSGTLLGWTH